jgi:23S rRNA (guanosine2251-2'-O)-methyltransferase
MTGRSSGPPRPPARRRSSSGRRRGRVEHREGDESELLYGVHPILEALSEGSRRIDRILVAREGGARLGRLLRQARQAGVPVSHLPRKVLERRAGAGVTHQGVAAVVSAVEYAETEAFLAGSDRAPEAILVGLDRVQDPRNLGAIIRTAAAAGAEGILLGSEGSVGMTPTVAKTSAGAVERIPVARVPRLPAAIRRLRREGGFRALALDPRADTSWDEPGLEGRIVILAGGEGAGLTRGVLQACDGRISVPMARGVQALNVAVSVGVVLFEAVRQRRAAQMTHPAVGPAGSGGT